MKSVLIALIFVMIGINLICYIYGRKCLKKVQESKEENEAMYKKGMKFIVATTIISFISIITVSVLAILNIWA